MDSEQHCYFRDAFRNARASALRDTEAFGELLFSIERFGTALNPKARGFSGKARLLHEFALASPLAEQIPQQWREYHPVFQAVYEQLRQARNDALHDGAYARHLTGHAVLIALTLEDALMTGIDRVADYMVRMPVCACMWHPLSFVRQTMLASSFSFLPINAGSEHAPDWRLISDCAVAAFLRSPDAPNRSARLGVTIRQAVEEHGLVLKQPHLCTIDDVVQAALANCQGLPVLIVSKDHKMLLGIATPFDLL